jgi:nucleoid-associated protein YgaU
MSVSRYTRTSRILGGSQLGTSRAHSVIHLGIENGTIDYKTVVTEEGDRLDHIAGKELGDSQLWWVIAAASRIGWWLQVPPGTVLRIPTKMTQVMAYVG